MDGMRVYLLNFWTVVDGFHDGIFWKTTGCQAIAGKPHRFCTWLNIYVSIIVFSLAISKAYFDFLFLIVNQYPAGVPPFRMSLIAASVLVSKSTETAWTVPA